MSQLGLWGRRQEEGVESLCCWLDSLRVRPPGERWGVWGGVVGGSSGAVGAAMGVMGGAMQVPPQNFVFWIPLVCWLALSASMTSWVVRKNREDWAGWSQEPRGVMNRLAVARWHGQLRQIFGNDGASILNEAARIVVGCKAVLDSAGWKAAAGGETWGAVRDKALRSLDSAMARTVLVVTTGAPVEEAKAVLTEMQELFDEVARVGKQHANLVGTSAAGSEGIREALSELRELAAAGEELESQSEST